MKHDPDVEDLRLWSVITSTVRPLKASLSHVAKPLAVGAQRVGDSPAPAKPTAVAPVTRLPHPGGLTFDTARAALTRFILRSVDQGWRSVLVITGKGNLGEGVIRRHAPEWLGEPPLREHVAGISQAHRLHGGEGALYVALKRKG